MKSIYILEICSSIYYMLADKSVNKGAEPFASLNIDIYYW